MAHDFLANKRTFDRRSHLILLQPIFVGAENFEQNYKGIDELIVALVKIFGASHEVVVYEATTGLPIIRSVPLSLICAPGLVRGNCSLYVPPQVWGNALTGLAW
jgi:hypothetical protein